MTEFNSFNHKKKLNCLNDQIKVARKSKSRRRIRVWSTDMTGDLPPDGMMSEAETGWSYCKTKLAVPLFHLQLLHPSSAVTTVSCVSEVPPALRLNIQRHGPRHVSAHDCNHYCYLLLLPRAPLLTAVLFQEKSFSDSWTLHFFCSIYSLIYVLFFFPVFDWTNVTSPADHVQQLRQSLSDKIFCSESLFIKETPFRVARCKENLITDSWSEIIGFPPSVFVRLWEGQMKVNKASRSRRLFCPKPLPKEIPDPGL